MWLTFLAGLALGVIDVLAPLRLNRLGAERSSSPGSSWARPRSRSCSLPWSVGWRTGGGAWPRCVCRSVAAIVVERPGPWLRPLAVLGVLLVIGLPAFGTLFVPAAAMIGDGADRRQLHHGLAYGLGNLAWASGQGIAAAASGALAQATIDAVPYLLMAATMAATAWSLRRRGDHGIEGGTGCRRDWRCGHAGADSATEVRPERSVQGGLRGRSRP